MTAPAALVLGEALVDLIRRTDRPDHPDDARVGGSPLNVAVGLSRLGLASALVAPVGSDRHGQLVRAHLAANEVALVGASDDVRTSSALASIGTDGAADYDFDITWSTPALPPALRPRLVHAGSVAAVLGHAELLPLLAALRESATISYDPNVRPQLMGGPDEARGVVGAYLDTSDVVKASSEDVAWLHPGRAPDEVAEEWLARGPSLVVVTDGAQGAFAVARSGRADIAAGTAEVVDTIGAGDSFMAGLLAALDDEGLLGRDRSARLADLDRTTLERVLGFAATCAAITVSRPGADPPRRAEVVG